MLLNTVSVSVLQFDWFLAKICMNGNKNAKHRLSDTELLSRY